MDRQSPAPSFGSWALVQPAAPVERLASISKISRRKLFEDTGPDPVKTDDNGRFVLRGVGRGLYVHVVVDDPRFGRQVLEVTSDDLMGPLDVTLTLKPAKSIEGRVIAADTRQPVVGTLISAGSSVVHADAEGRYRAISAGDLISVHAYPPAGEPYLIAAVDVAWNKGMVKQQLDIALRRGVLMLGRVTEQGTGRPLEGASVMFVPVDGAAGVESKWQSTVPSQSDGSFRIVVPQGKGHLLVFGPTSDYIHTVIGSLDADERPARRRALVCTLHRPI